MKTNSISFSELRKFNDSNSAVLMATIFPEGFDYTEVDEFLKNDIGFSKGKNLIGVHFINGNVKGEDGRKDWLLEFSHEEIQFNPIARLRFPDLKWTSDFIDNFHDDYFDEPHPMNSHNTQMPLVKKYKLTFERRGVEDFMMLYAESDVDAYQQFIDAWGFEPNKVEESK